MTKVHKLVLYPNHFTNYFCLSRGNYLRYLATQRKHVLSQNVLRSWNMAESIEHHALLKLRSHSRRETEEKEIGKGEDTQQNWCNGTRHSSCQMHKRCTLTRV